MSCSAVSSPVRPVIRRHLMHLAAFLEEPQPGAAGGLHQVLNVHADGGRYAREAVDHGGDRRRSRRPTRVAVSIDSISRLASAAVRIGGLAALVGVGRPADRRCGIGVEHALTGQPVEQAPQRRQPLLDRLRREAAAEALYIS